MKVCSKCKIEYEVTAENFGPDKRTSDGFQPQCRGCCRAAVKKCYAENPEKCRAASRKYYAENLDKRKAYTKKYYGTLDGYIYQLFRNMTGRCAGQKSYIDRGTKNKFKNFEHLKSYIVEILKIDPRGLDCHRTDSGGHCEPGNIEFLMPEEHVIVHAEMRSVK